MPPVAFVAAAVPPEWVGILPAYRWRVEPAPKGDDLRQREDEPAGSRRCKEMAACSGWHLAGAAKATDDL